MDRLTERLKKKKPKSEEVDSGKKDKIMGMHAEGDEINLIRCESCGQRFPGNTMVEKDGLYYCKDCFQKIDINI